MLITIKIFIRFWRLLSPYKTCVYCLSTYCASHMYIKYKNTVNTCFCPVYTRSVAYYSTYMYPRVRRPFIFFSRKVWVLRVGAARTSVSPCRSQLHRVPTYCVTRVIDYVNGLVMHFVHENEKSITFLRSLRPYVRACTVVPMCVCHRL